MRRSRGFTLIEILIALTMFAVIGGGLLGLEAAAGLRMRGMQVTVVHLMGHLMERQLDEEHHAEAACQVREITADHDVTLAGSLRTGTSRLFAVPDDGTDQIVEIGIDPGRCLRRRLCPLDPRPVHDRLSRDAPQATATSSTSR